jgi:pimeloyl-ACP methyl ester carboxylesterase
MSAHDGTPLLKSSQSELKQAEKGKTVQVTTTRTIGYQEHGLVDGKPVFFFPGAGFGRTTAPTNGKILSELGLRFIACDRPGYGTSTRKPNRTLLDWAEDVNKIMDELKIEKAHFVAHSAGCPHLLAFCYKYPNRIIRAAVVCPPNPIQGDEIAPEGCGRKVQICCLLHCLCCMKPMYRSLLQGWTKDPNKFADFSRKTLLAPKDKEWMKSDPNNEPTLFSHFRAASCEPPEGAEAILDDMLIPGNHWGFKVSQVTCPIDVWYGAVDNVTPNGAWMAKTMRNATPHRMEGYGHNLIFCEFDAILRELVKVSDKEKKES